MFKHVVAPPQKVHLGHFGGAFSLVKDAARKVGASCAINMGYFSMSKTHPVDSVPVGQVMLNGENLVLSDGIGHFHSVYRKDGVVRFWDWLPDGCDWGIRAGPRLIQDGKVNEWQIADIRWALGGIQHNTPLPRVAIGKRADEQVILAYDDNATLWDFAQKLLALGCVEALAGDGGGSASWYTPDVQIGARAVPNMIYVEGDEKPAPTPKTLKVYISPSQQPDNIGVGNYGTEQAQMRSLAFILAARMSSAECEVAVARSGMTMAEVRAESDAWGADVHICLHSNASVKHNAIGCEAFYCPGSVVGKRLAERVYEKLCDENPNGGRRCAATGFYELRETKAWAVYIECGFHDNATEAAWIVKASTGIAKAVAAAISDEFMEV